MDKCTHEVTFTIQKQDPDNPDVYHYEHLSVIAIDGYCPKCSSKVLQIKK